MRKRILQSTVTVAVVAVLLLGVPLAVAASLVARRSTEALSDRAAVQVWRAAEQRQRQAEQITPEIFSSLPDEGTFYVEVTTRDLESGRIVRLTHGEKPARVIPGMQEANGINVQAFQASSAAYPNMLQNALLVLVVAFFAVLVAVALGLWQAQRLAEPLVDLAQRARRLGSGTAKPRFARYDIEEVDRVAEVLERSAERMNAMLAAERQFASDASHQLRTPLTALSMRLEEILHSDDTDIVREEARIALEQVERLAGTVDHLLSRTRKQRAATAVPLQMDDVIAQQVEEWKPAFANAGRHLKVAGTRGLQCSATPGGISQIIATLLENSLVHGAGTVTVRTRWSGGSVVVEVGDEGPGVAPEMAPLIFERSVSTRASTGLGLALARDLAEADGGRLALVALRPAVFALFLNVPDGFEPRRGRLRKVVA